MRQIIAVIFFLIVLINNAATDENANQNSENVPHMHPPPSDTPHRVKREIFHNDAVDGEKTSHYWNVMAQMKLRDQLLKHTTQGKAKNVIFFLGDGMSLATIVASRTYLGQLNGFNGEEFRLPFEEFPFLGLAKTYCVDKQVADSACSATAYLCGIKANYGTIGVNAQVKYNDCPSSNNTRNFVSSIAQWAIDAKKAAGIVTTTRVTHASPAGTYAHVGNRDWESDTDVKLRVKDPNCYVEDIASQLVRNSPGKDFKVILGGGRRKFLPKQQIDEEGSPGDRSDGVNLISEWKRSKTGKAAYISNREQLYGLNFTETDYLLGLFEADHMQYNLDANPATEPTLGELTAAAIRLLKKEENGYFLFVEGGRIDHAHHDSKARKSLDETIEFSKAVQAAVELTDHHETLIVVTADHSHTMTISGYSNRGADILGVNTESSDMDAMPYSTLSYANGPGYKEPTRTNRYNITKDDLKNPDYRYPSTVPLRYETHGGDDVPIYALGPWAHLFGGTLEQNVIPHVVAYASCIGNGLSVCQPYYN